LPVLLGTGKSSLGAYRGKVVLLNFWASWCVPCGEEAPLLEGAERRLAAHDATVLGVTYEDNTPDSESFIGQYHLTYPNLRDVDGEFAHSYGTDQLPESFLIDRQGEIVAISRGEIDKTFTERAVSLAQST
jgi:cytochrome c biogenesis protein CcmG/thiol:disulfide interchange protein DsbE